MTMKSIEVNRYDQPVVQMSGELPKNQTQDFKELLDLNLLSLIFYRQIAEINRPFAISL